MTLQEQWPLFLFLLRISVASGGSGTGAAGAPPPCRSAAGAERRGCRRRRALPCSIPSPPVCLFPSALLCSAFSPSATPSAGQRRALQAGAGSEGGPGRRAVAVVQGAECGVRPRRHRGRDVGVLINNVGASGWGSLLERTQLWVGDLFLYITQNREWGSGLGLRRWRPSERIRMGNFFHSCAIARSYFTLLSLICGSRPAIGARARLAFGASSPPRRCQKLSPRYSRNAGES